MGLGEFAAQKAGEETVEVRGKTYDCVKVTIVLTAFSWACKGLLWHDKKTGQLVKTGKKGNKAAEGARYVGWIPVRQTSSGKTLEFDLIFEVE